MQWFSADFDAVPDFAPPLAPSEQELVDKMQTTVSNAQAKIALSLTCKQQHCRFLMLCRVCNQA